MKTHIFCFSGTGNSLNVARLIAEELGDSEVISIAEAISKEVDASFDRLGIVFPVYGWGLPLIVRDFLKKVRTDKYVFAVATYGGRLAGTLGLVKRSLSENDTELNLGMVVKMPDNCILISGAQPAEKQELILREAGVRVKKIAGIIRDGKTGYVEEGHFPENWLLSGIMYGMAAKKIEDQRPLLQGGRPLQILWHVCPDVPREEHRDGGRATPVAGPLRAMPDLLTIVPQRSDPDRE